MAEVTIAKVTQLVKQNNDISQKAVADKIGVSLGQVSMLLFCQAKVAAGVYSKAPPTAASVKKLRDSEGNRWELIAARTGLSVAKAREVYGGEGAARDSYTGRGRPSGGTTAKRSSVKSGSAKRGSAASGTTKKKSAAASRKAGATSRKGGIVRNTTSRRRSSANPS